MSELSNQTCARRVCRRKVPRVALRQGDVHCSTECFRLDNGTLTAAQVAASLTRRERVLASGGDQAWRERGHAAWEARERDTAA